MRSPPTRDDARAMHSHSPYGTAREVSDFGQTQSQPQAQCFQNPERLTWPRATDPGMFARRWFGALSRPMDARERSTRKSQRRQNPPVHGRTHRYGALNESENELDDER